MQFGVHPSGIEFKLFGPPHLIALGIILALNLALIPLRHLLREAGRRGFRLGLAALLLLTESIFILWLVRSGLWTVREGLPLQLCSIMIYVSAALLITRNRLLYELVYFLGIGGAIQALVTPPLVIYGYPHFYFFEEFIAHGGIVTAGIYMTLVEGFRPSWRSVWRVAGCMLAYMAVIMVVNALLGSNYLFIAHHPGFPSLIDHLGPWPWYILSLIGVGMATVLLLYLPFALKDRLHRSAPGGEAGGASSRD